MDKTDICTAADWCRSLYELSPSRTDKSQGLRNSKCQRLQCMAEDERVTPTGFATGIKGTSPGTGCSAACSGLFPSGTPETHSRSKLLCCFYRRSVSARLSCSQHTVSVRQTLRRFVTVMAASAGLVEAVVRGLVCRIRLGIT